MIRYAEMGRPSTPRRMEEPVQRLRSVHEVELLNQLVDAPRDRDQSAHVLDAQLVGEHERLRGLLRLLRLLRAERFVLVVLRREDVLVYDDLDKQSITVEAEFPRADLGRCCRFPSGDRSGSRSRCFA
jgi:hypothetical protein